jgi:kynurenine--oxoglutarate transaminase/cysteine-S-conjugate beta-lyase/glutamine--phenylpyruvate transaminase
MRAAWLKHSSTISSSNSRPKLSVEHPSAFQPSQRLKGLDTASTPSVWHEFGDLVAKHGSIDLGPGIPEWNPPDFVIQAMKKAVKLIDNRFPEFHRKNTPVITTNPLKEALASIYTKRWHWEGRPIDPSRHVAVSALGCANLLFCAFQALLNPGDEVIVMEPACDIYANQIRMAGGIPVYVPLRYGKNTSTLQSITSPFTLDMDEFEAAITDRTKIVLINTPHNPTGKVLTPKELQAIAAIVEKHPTMTIISDEVYDNLTYETSYHTPMAIYNPFQTLTVSSSAKNLSVVGWNVGWALGPAHLIRAVTVVLQWVQNSTRNTPQQDAMAECLLQAENPYEDPETGNQFDTYYQYLATCYNQKRTLLYECLRTAKMTPIPPQGGMYMLADTSGTDFPYENYRQTGQSTDSILNNRSIVMPRDWALCRWLTEEVGVTPMPTSSAFYHSEDQRGTAQSLVRFSMAKNDDTLSEVQHRLEMYFGLL